MPRDYGWQQMDWGVGGWTAMVFMMLIFWIAVVALVIWSVRHFSRTRSLQATGNPAEETLRHRYASGEIDHAEFTTRLSNLRSGT
jgi:uncharacterized membrane protein